MKIKNIKAQINNSVIDFGLFTEDAVEKAKNALKIAYPDAVISIQDVEHNVLRYSLNGENQVLLIPDEPSALSSEVLEPYYREQKRRYQIEDAKAHAEDMKVTCSIKDNEWDELVEIFDKVHDCNIAENDLWESVIDNFLDNKGRL